MRTDFTNFISTVNYTQESPGNAPLVVGLKLGTGPLSLAGYTAGLFGALGVATGLTTDKWFIYENSSQLIADLNGGLSGSEVTFNSNFVASYNGITGPSRAMIELGSALSTLAYGCTVVIFGSYEGAKDYQSDPLNDALEAFVIEEQNNSIDKMTPTTGNLILGMTSSYPGFAAATVTPTGGYNAVALIKQTSDFNNVFFFHSSLSGADYNVAQNVLSGTDYSVIQRYVGMNGTSSTYYSFDDAATSYYLTTDQLSRIFCVIGKKTTEYQMNSGNNFGFTDDLCTVESILAYDAAGAMARAKTRNELFYSIAGVDRSTVLNANAIVPTFSVTSDSITDLKTNRVNYYVTSNANGTFFLGSDVVGATGTVTLESRIGPAYLKSKISTDVYTIGETYLFQINNAATRSNYTDSVTSYLDNYANVLNTDYTQVICDETNNTDGDSTLNMTVVIRPIISTTDIVVTITLTS